MAEAKWKEGKQLRRRRRQEIHFDDGGQCDPGPPARLPTKPEAETAAEAAFRRPKGREQEDDGKGEMARESGEKLWPPQTRNKSSRKRAQRHLKTSDQKWVGSDGWGSIGPLIGEDRRAAKIIHSFYKDLM